ncbi:MAG: serine O-acetyltransferase [Psychromonas sp.]|jgi:serine O-acetyltransferase|uniref:serine O-acetyltransferase n=1 Tax=Psychromonas sp. TaxID=1884585 RepID=UPI0039E3F80D
MINNKQDLLFYLAADKFSLGIKHKHPKINDEIWKFQIALRNVEFYKNTTKNLLKKIALIRWQLKKRQLALKLGFDIPENVFGAGLCINHFGNLIVNNQAKIGMWCDIHQGVNIGANNSNDNKVLVPTVGDNVWIGPGAKLFGDILIGNHVAIGANAVVNKTFSDDITLAGIPAKEIKNKGTREMNIAASKKRVDNFFLLNPAYKKYELS